MVMLSKYWKMMTLLLGTLSLTLGCQGQKTDIRKSLEAEYAKIIRFMKQADFKGYTQTLTDDFVFVDTDNKPDDKTFYLEVVKQRMDLIKNKRISDVKFKYKIVDINVSGNTAIAEVFHTFEYITSRKRKERFESELSETWTKTNTGWKVKQVVVDVGRVYRDGTLTKTLKRKKDK